MRHFFLLSPLLFCLACASPPAISKSPPGLSTAASQVSVQAPESGALADGAEAVTLRATLVDNANAPVVGASVIFVVSGTGNQVGAAGATDANGVATAQLTSTHGETKTVSAIATPTGGVPVQLTRTAQALFVARVLAIAGDTGPVPADGNALAHLTLTVTRGAGGAAMPGLPVTWTVGGTRNQLVSGGSATDANGQAQATLASLQGESKTVTASLGGVGDTASVQVAFSATHACGATSLLAGIPWLATPTAQGAASLVDVDADGHLDLVQAASDSNAVYLHAGLGTGLFATPHSLPLPVRANTVTVADVNGDARPDLVVWSNLSLLTLLNEGPGQWSTPVVSTLPGDSDTTFPIAVLVAELTGDAHLDVAATVSVDPNILTLTLRGDGKGSFVADPNPYTAPLRANGLASADLNGDGATDLLAIHAVSSTDSNQVLSVVLNDGHGAFSDSPNPYALIGNAVGPTLYGTQLATLRLNGDAHLDVVVVANGTLTTFLGDGQGGLTPAQELPAAAQTVTVVDVNGDGRQDVVVGTMSSPPTSYENIYLSAGDGNVLDPVSYPAAYSANAWQFGDLNGDGTLDRVFTVAGSDSLGVALGRPGNVFGSADFFYGLPSDATTNTQSLASADFNGDAHPDLLAENDGQLALLINQVGATDGNAFVRHPLDGLPSAPGPFVVVDVNQDSHSDFVVADGASAKLTVMRGVGDANFVASQSPNSTQSVQTLTAADVNRDGAPDLIAPLASGGFDVFLNAGDGNFADGAFVATPTLGTNAVVAEVTGDGNADVLAVTDANLLLLAGDGQGAFAAPVTVLNLSAVASASSSINVVWAPVWLLAQDFTGDGQVDVLVAGAPGSSGFGGSGSGPAFVLLTGHGDGTFTAGTAFGTVTTGQMGVPQRVDTDGDGVLDLIMPNAAGYIAVLHGHPDGTFDPGAYYGSGVAVPQLVAAQDFNGDGQVDLAQLGLGGVQVSRSGGCDFPVQPPVQRSGCAAAPTSVWALLAMGGLLRRVLRRSA